MKTATKKKVKKCSCLTKLNETLRAEHGAELVGGLAFNADLQTMRMDYARFHVKSLSRKRPPLVCFTYCPVCGTKII